MSKIQVVTNSSYTKNGYKVSKLYDNDTFDSYDYNIIDLGDNSIWCFDGDYVGGSNLEKDLLSLKKQILYCKKCKFIIIFPMNINYFYSYVNRSIRLRDAINCLRSITNMVLGFYVNVEYEHNKTDLNGTFVESDFYFTEDYSSQDKTLRSINSNKIVSFSVNNITCTTLNLLDSDVVDKFLNVLYEDNVVEYPSWFETITFNDDVELKEKISTNTCNIKRLEEEIKKCNDILNQNNFYKRILVETGCKLVEVVFDILEKILGIDLSFFVDEKKEDFNFQLDNNSYVGEIKGVSDGIKNSYLSQLENNKQLFMEKNEIGECKGILIINDQRQKSLEQREDVHENQKKYARDHKLLIIQTKVLIEIYEAFLKKELDVNKFKNIISNQSGILTDEWR